MSRFFCVHLTRILRESCAILRDYLSGDLIGRIQKMVLPLSSKLYVCLARTSASFGMLTSEPVAQNAAQM